MSSVIVQLTRALESNLQRKQKLLFRILSFSENPSIIFVAYVVVEMVVCDVEMEIFIGFQLFCSFLN